MISSNALLDGFLSNMVPVYRNSWTDYDFDFWIENTTKNKLVSLKSNEIRKYVKEVTGLSYRVIILDESSELMFALKLGFKECVEIF